MTRAIKEGQRGEQRLFAEALTLVYNQEGLSYFKRLAGVRADVPIRARCRSGQEI